MKKALSWLAIIVALVALIFCGGLLAGDTIIRLPGGIPTGAISAVPLFLIGVAFIGAQFIIRPRWPDLIKNLLLAAAFVLWSVVQVMPQGELAKTLGDVVIALYVLDLAWVIFDSVRQAGTVPSGASASKSSVEE